MNSVLNFTVPDLAVLYFAAGTGGPLPDALLLAVLRGGRWGETLFALWHITGFYADLPLMKTCNAVLALQICRGLNLGKLEKDQSILIIFGEHFSHFIYFFCLSSCIEIAFTYWTIHSFKVYK